MRKLLRPVLIGLAGFLLGVGCLFAFFKLSPDTGRSLLGLQESHRSSKPITSAFNLAPNKTDEDEEAAQAPPPAPVPNAAGAPGRRALPPGFDQDDADFFGGQDPFVAARKMQEQIEKQMQAGFAGMGGAAVAGGEQITTKEDDHSVSFEIKGVEGSTLNTSVKDGYLTITGETKSQQAGMSFQSMFQRSFPLPPNVDSTKMQTISEKDKVVLRFPKREG